MWTPRHPGSRGRGRPCIRWSDDLSAFAGGDWATVALDSELWSTAEMGYVLRLS